MIFQHRSSVLGMLVVLFAACFANATYADEAASRPNILYFYVDDMGWGSIGPNGQAKRKAEGLPYVRTPNIDALARQGVNFIRGYGCHVCSPARSSQQTGFHQGHTFADRNDPNNAKKAIRADDITMGDALSSAGYVTGYWGKWGYGGSKSQADPVIQNVQTLPTSHGYRHVLAELHHVRAHTFFQPTLWNAPAPATTVGGMQLVANAMQRYQGRDDYPSLPAFQNHPNYPTPAYCDDAYAFAALDFVRQQGQNFNQTGQPFFGLLAAQIPHAPFGEIAALPNWDQAYEDDPTFDSLSDQSRQWAAMVTRIDAHFGNILQALKDPNGDGDESDSIADDTLVIFQSDNGGPRGDSHEELASNGNLRGVKGMIQEGGLRVPLVMRWPAKINETSKLKSGSNTDMIVDVTDLLPTFCDLAGADVPLGIDGVSIAPTLADLPGQRSREFLIHEAGNSASIIRGRHKLIRRAGPKQHSAKPTLHDLVEDPGETKDIADEHPEIVRRLETLLRDERVDEPRGFANTYHHWTGETDAVTSNAEHWSDYEYSNAGITYTVENGPPRPSWVARMENTTNAVATAIVDQDLDVLALQISGHPDGAKQIVQMNPRVRLSARNELRLNKHSVLRLNGGQLSTLRWIEISDNGSLDGAGQIHGSVDNHGAVRCLDTANGNLIVAGDFHQDESGTLTVALASTAPAIRVSGEARLSGRLQIELPTGFDAKPETPYVVLASAKLVGRFSVPHNQVTASDGTRFRISYKDQSVLATAITH